MTWLLLLCGIGLLIRVSVCARFLLPNRGVYQEVGGMYIPSPLHFSFLPLSVSVLRIPYTHTIHASPFSLKISLYSSPESTCRKQLSLCKNRSSNTHIHIYIINFIPYALPYLANITLNRLTLSSHPRHSHSHSQHLPNRALLVLSASVSDHASTRDTKCLKSSGYSRLGDLLSSRS